MNNVISINRINCLTLGQTHLTSLSEQSLTSTANIRQSVIGCQPSSSMGVNGPQLETVYSFTHDCRPIEVVTKPVEENELTLMYNFILSNV